MKVKVGLNEPVGEFKGVGGIISWYFSVDWATRDL